MISQAISDVAKNGRGGKGTLVFCAAGNGSIKEMSYPANHPDTIAVGASTNRDTKAIYSQWGNGLEFVAPSNGGTRNIENTDIQGNFGYNTNTGLNGDSRRYLN